MLVSKSKSSKKLGGEEITRWSSRLKTTGEVWLLEAMRIE